MARGDNPLFKFDYYEELVRSVEDTAVLICRPYKDNKERYEKCLTQVENNLLSTIRSIMPKNELREFMKHYNDTKRLEQLVIASEKYEKNGYAIVPKEIAGKFKDLHPEAVKISEIKNKIAFKNPRR